MVPNFTDNQKPLSPSAGNISSLTDAPIFYMISQSQNEILDFSDNLNTVAIKVNPYHTDDVVYLELVDSLLYPKRMDLLVLDAPTET
ncbi:hypothetical protein H646_00685 [Francisella tularensis subsp. tularensis 79201237]|nr:hypothetical protein NE061598_00690 [Francisella tularensis subsp. tularensis NE061598]AKE21621.1 hypothetical protein RO31_0138 [Francisella tularensis subsp. tularensis str. SCHU S4 substr. NR-28534]EOA44070.1 hypothetical protein H645_00685 [Francisella tularensis subsp. tularensis 80700075]EOA45620.1 hypothetical protein H647_00695 [Francisella tularensis subsp. tularensis 80700069]EOA45976.1 hypothetical protein H646_00685 [Francisella tularensis subsp. tularensis 79201237]